jgi:hypothetical protein
MAGDKSIVMEGTGMDFQRRLTVKNLYVPLSFVTFAAIVMVSESLLPGNHTEPHPEFWAIATKIALYFPVLALSMGICSWFGYPFSPTLGSFLQLLSVALLPGALSFLAGHIAGISVGSVVSLITFLVLIAYFFNDEPITALIAIFVIVAAHQVVNMILVIVSSWIQFRL